MKVNFKLLRGFFRKFRRVKLYSPRVQYHLLSALLSSQSYWINGYFENFHSKKFTF